MKSLITTSVLTLALVGAVGCAEEAGVRNSGDKYTVPEATPYAAPAARGQVTGVTGEPSGAGGMDLSGEARPGMWDASRSAEVEQPVRAPSPYKSLPAGSAPEPQGGRVQTQQPAAAQSVPPTVNNGGNTAGTTTGR